MEVLKTEGPPALVSNLEVMQLLQERVDARQSQDGSSKGKNQGGEDKTGRKKGPFQNRDWIEQTVLNHLQSSPVGGADVKSEDMPKLVERLRRDYGLTNAEVLKTLNHLPTTLVEVHLLIEDIDKREELNDEEKQSDFLRLVAKFSGRQVDEGGGEGEDNANESMSLD